eukprot:Hpha_TRINITY_DN11487_c0_g2::TRINITY_DN11487_c0_g2_i1::g.137371::m.137371/K17914/KIF13; kinesin family member 13
MEIEADVRKKGKGEENNVKVMVRVRPFVLRELTGLEPNDFPLSIVNVSENNRTVSCEGARFEFDTAFWSMPDYQRQSSLAKFSDQEAVYETVGSPAVGHALAGYHSTIFAYGQTGSGKTYSMLGTPKDPGIAPRIVAQLFSQIEQLHEQRKRRRAAKGFFSHSVEISFFEIYKERIKDLFQVEDRTSSNQTRRVLKRRGSLNVGGLQNVRSSLTRSPSALIRTPLSQRPPLESPAATPNLRRQNSSHERRRAPGWMPPSSRSQGDRLSAPSNSPGLGAARNPFMVSPRADSVVEGGEALSMGRMVVEEIDLGDESAREKPRRRSSVVVPGTQGESDGSAPEGLRRRRSSVIVHGNRDESAESHGLPRKPQPSPQPGLLGRRNSRSVLPITSLDHDDEYQDLRVRQSQQRGTFVEGLKRLGAAEGISGPDDVLKLMRCGMLLRATAETGMNLTSSRSHAIFQICVKSRNQVTGVQRYAHINLVDLAGSERLKMSGAEGERKVEAAQINLSLHVLRRVIDTLIENQQLKRGQNKRVIPWRDSILTRVLADSLGGNSKTVMFATVSPAEDCREDTLNTLKYAHRAKDIVNTVFVNEQRTEQVLSLMQLELKELRDKLQEEEEHGEYAQVERLKSEIKTKEDDYKETIVDIERTRAEHEQTEESLRIVESTLLQSESQLEELRRLRVEEDHSEEFQRARTQEQEAEIVMDRLTEKRREKEILERMRHMEEQEHAVANQQQQIVLRRELSTRQELMVTKRSGFVSAFNKAFKEEARASRLGCHDAELEVIGAKERAALTDMTISSERHAKLEFEITLLLSKQRRADAEMASVDAVRTAEEGRSQDKLKALRSAHSALEKELIEAAGSNRAFETQAATARKQKSRKSEEQREKVRRATLKMETVKEELNSKLLLLQQLKKQASVLREELDQVNEHTDLFRTAGTQMAQETAELRESVKKHRAENAQLNEWVDLHTQLVREGARTVSDLWNKSLEGRDEVSTVRRNHDDMRMFVSSRFFPTKEAPQEKPPPPPAAIAAPPRQPSPNRTQQRSPSRSAISH